jgi:hypothetical protein
LIKIASCELCGRYYRTGKIRQVIEKALGEGNKFKEWRKAVCNGCYDSIIRGDGVLQANTLNIGEDIIDGDTLGVIKQLSEDSKASGKLVDAISKPKKERKKRKSKVHDSEIARSIRAGTGELAPDDEDTDKKEPKKRGRKPKLVTAKAIREKTYKEKEDILFPEGSNPDSLVKDVSKFDQAFPTPEMIENDVVIPTSMPSLKDTITENEFVPTEATVTKVEDVHIQETTPVSAKDRKYYKDKVREALASNSNIMYSDIAKKLGVDEGLVGKLAGELDIE